MDDIFEGAGTIEQVAAGIEKLSQGNQSGGGWLGDLLSSLTGRRSKMGNENPLGNQEDPNREISQDSCKDDLERAKSEITKLRDELEDIKNKHERRQEQPPPEVAADVGGEEPPYRPSGESSNPGNQYGNDDKYGSPEKEEGDVYRGGGRHTQIKTFKELLASALRDLESLTKKMKSIQDMVNK